MTVHDLNLNLNPSYTALSYVWGSVDSKIDTISCNDIAFPVTPNCYSALWHLRKILGSFTIWIDAISLNQEDKVEKAHQIGLMGEIYSSATTTFIWLGEETTSIERTIKFLSNAGFLEYFFDYDGDP